MRALENKATHRDCIARDSLLVELALKTGMRRAAGQASRRQTFRQKVQTVFTKL